MNDTTQLAQLPSHRRRGILLGTSANRAQLELSKEGRRYLANEQFLFIDIDDLDDVSDPILASLSRRDLIQPELFLVQSPTNRLRYERLSQAGNVMVQEKMEATVHVCQSLGARQVQILHVERETLQSGARAGAEVGASADPLSISVAQIEARKETSELQIDDRRILTSWSFQGADPDVAAAQESLERSGVRDDSLEQMIRLFDSPNRPLRHSFEISTESDMRKFSDLVFGLTIPFGKAQGEIESFRQSHSVFRMQLEATFGPSRGGSET